MGGVVGSGGVVGGWVNGWMVVVGSWGWLVVVEWVGFRVCGVLVKDVVGGGGKKGGGMGDGGEEGGLWYGWWGIGMLVSFEISEGSRIFRHGRSRSPRRSKLRKRKWGRHRDWSKGCQELRLYIFSMGGWLKVSWGG